jgi:hypothetical protein
LTPERRNELSLAMNASKPFTPRTTALLLLGLSLATAGCATTSGAELDTKFAAGWRPSKAECAFGGATAKLGAWCAEVNFGEQGLTVLARAINEEVLRRNGGEPLVCTDHVAQVRAEFAAYPGYTVSELYSCDANPPVENGRSVCHVSLMVASAGGSRVVLDNGHVVNAHTESGVARYSEFTRMVAYHWTGDQPSSVVLSSRP